MVNQTTDACIGIDGGGTNCRFALRLGARRWDVKLAGANASTDFDRAVETLRSGLDQLATAAGITDTQMAEIPTFIGLAGVMDAAMGAAIATALPQKNVTVEDDKRTAMVGALGASDGCILGIGTGTFIGRRAGGVDRLIGGWGLVLGDVASGGYLGRGLLSRVLEVEDGLHPASELTRETLAELTSPAAIVGFAARATPGDFARFAPRIVEAANAGDINGLALVQDGAAHIARRLKHLGWQSDETIVPIGGLAPHYAPFLPAEMAACIVPPQGSSLDGALTLAAQMGEK
ncbi:BadF/BadG/BcrA/BcrD ATPase family protein [Gymnodinialimonas sp. 57CJ19]|uniref:BadF/BadG/BcrA/BcrD ATPase family protein n=1 Tax=Gymnodinialimonas sp. 57CJ19 TaxID=3138498 RepID=UPI00313429CB